MCGDGALGFDGRGPGLPTTLPLRQTAATETSSVGVGAGAALCEVAQLMRHASVATIVSYTKTDQNRLARTA